MRYELFGDGRAVVEVDDVGTQTGRRLVGRVAVRTRGCGEADLEASNISRCPPMNMLFYVIAINYQRPQAYRVSVSASRATSDNILGITRQPRPVSFKPLDVSLTTPLSMRLRRNPSRHKFRLRRRNRSTMGR